MSDPNAHHDEEDLKPTMTAGYRLGEKKTAEEYAKLDAEDESLNRWKASLGIDQAAAVQASGQKLSVYTLFLTSPSLNGRQISLNVSDPQHIAEVKKNPINIKEGVEYNVGITFKVNHSIISGLRYMHVVKRAGLKVDKYEQMLGSYGPKPDGSAYTSQFDPEESPSGMLARSGTYTVRSRVIDDDGEIYADFEWSFKLTKEW